MRAPPSFVIQSTRWTRIFVSSSAAAGRHWSDSPHPALALLRPQGLRCLEVFSVENLIVDNPCASKYEAAPSDGDGAGTMKEGKKERGRCLRQVRLTRASPSRIAVSAGRYFSLPSRITSASTFSPPCRLVRLRMSKNAVALCLPHSMPATLSPQDHMPYEAFRNAKAAGAMDLITSKYSPRGPEGP